MVKTFVVGHAALEQIRIEECSTHDAAGKDIRSCDLDEETKRVFGTKPTFEEELGGIHDISKRTHDLVVRIPVNSEGEKLLPGILYPYFGLLIVPDHLLTSHGKDCINAALQLLPSSAYRKSYETFAISAMKEYDLPSQNRIVDNRTGVLLSMSLSEMYTLLFVSPWAFE